MIRFVFLSEAFYTQYQDCCEILIKERRPYALALVALDDITFAIPLRSHVKHAYVLYTKQACQCGLDFTKAVVICDVKLQINHAMPPHIRQDEFDALRGREYDIQLGMQQYLHAYRHALRLPSHPRNASLLEKSALQYFHKELGLD